METIKHPERCLNAINRLPFEKRCGNLSVRMTVSIIIFLYTVVKHHRIWLNTSCGLMVRVSAWDISNTTRAQTQNIQSGGAKTFANFDSHKHIAVSNYD